MVSNLNLLESRRRILLNTPHIETISDTIASFKTDIATKLKGCKIHFTPIQEGEGDPSPDNVRPIHGWDGVTVNACGKNLVQDIDKWEDGFLSTDGNVIAPSYRLEKSSDFISVEELATYTFSYNADEITQSKYTVICQYDENKNHLTRSTIANNVFTKTLIAGTHYIRLSLRTYGVAKNAQLELGSESTDYEPYTATTLTIPFPQTIYGGYVDLVKGEIVEEWTKVTLDGKNVKLNVGSYSNTLNIGAGWIYTSPLGITNVIAMAENMEVTRGSGTVPYLYQTPNGRLYFVLYPAKKVDYPDIDTTDRNQVLEFCNNWLKNNPIGVSYKLVTPNTYSIDPQTLKALRGMNNIWSDANGNVEVSYYTH